MHVSEMLDTSPTPAVVEKTSLVRCIEACFDCAQSCTSCADACLGEEMVAQLTQCIRLNLDCADICTAAGHIASRRTGSNEPIIQSVLKACEEACRLCAEECERHASMHEHCRICAESCRRCEQACQAALQTFH